MTRRSLFAALAAAIAGRKLAPALPAADWMPLYVRPIVPTSILIRIETAERAVVTIWQDRSVVDQFTLDPGQCCIYIPVPRLDSLPGFTIESSADFKLWSTAPAPTDARSPART